MLLHARTCHVRPTASSAAHQAQPLALRPRLASRIAPAAQTETSTSSRGSVRCAVASPAASRNGNSHADASSSSDTPAQPPPAPLMANLLLQCQDQKGVIAAVSQLLFGLNCNIVSSDQFTDSASNMFFQRITFDYTDIILGSGNTPVLERAINELANRFQMDWKISYQNKVKRLAILVSKQDHCLYDLLIRHKSGELRAEVPLIISNHPDLKPIADMFAVPFRYLPIDKANKEAQEQQIEDVLKEYDIDMLILARYMQIFSPGFCQRHWRHTINIHHSFLPAFEGARPYHRAHERGVKIIGATAHFATSELDAGPIIDQSVTRITHRDSVDDMIRKGKDLERLVLSKAVRWTLEDRVMIHGNKTVVFDD